MALFPKSLRVWFMQLSETPERSAYNRQLYRPLEEQLFARARGDVWESDQSVSPAVQSGV
jgi:hypothetical protein